VEGNAARCPPFLAYLHAPEELIRCWLLAPRGRPSVPSPGRPMSLSFLLEKIHPNEKFVCLSQSLNSHTRCREKGSDLSPPGC